MPDPAATPNILSSLLPAIPSNSAAETSRNEQLLQGTQQGLEGAQYLFGLKHPQVSTFYDEHPAQATAVNTLSYAPLLGTGVAALGVGHNLYKDYNHTSKIEDSLSEIRKGQLKDLASGKTPKKDEGLPSEELLNIFGIEAHDPRVQREIQTRLEPATQAVEKARDTFQADLRRYLDSPDFLQRTGGLDANILNHTGRLEQAFTTHLPALHELDSKRLLATHAGDAVAAAQAAKAYTQREELVYRNVFHPGGIGHSLPPAEPVLRNSLSNLLKTSVNHMHAHSAARSGVQGWIDRRAELEASGMTKDQISRYLVLHDAIKAMPAGERDISRSASVIARQLGMMYGDQAGTVEPTIIEHMLRSKHDAATAKEITDKVVNDYLRKPGWVTKLPEFAQETAHIGNNVGQQLYRLAGKPVAAGAALGAGGLGLAALLKMLQHRTYGDEKMKQWEDAARAVKGSS